MQSTYYYMRAVISPYDMLRARQYHKMDAEHQIAPNSVQEYAEQLL